MQTKSLCAETAQILLLFSSSTQDFTLSCSTLNGNKVFRSDGCFDVRKYLCPPFKKKKVSPIFSCKMHREKWPSPAF